MKINILTSQCKKGTCGNDCPYCRLNEVFSSLAGSDEFHNEEGILQEAVENIIPPAFNRLVHYAKLGAPPPGEANLPGQPGTMTPEELQTNMKKFIADRVRKDGLPKPAQDTMAQLIVRYAGRSYSRANSSNSIDFALNPSAVSLVFDRSFAILNTNLWWRSYRKYVLEMPDKDSELSQNQKRALVDTEQLNTWRETRKQKIEPFMKSFEFHSETPQQWLQKTRKMAADGASAQEILVVLGQQYKSYIKTIKKWFKRNPEFIDVQPELFELIRRQWNRWQGRLIQHAHNNLRKIAEHIKEGDNYQEVNALIKKHPSRNKVDPDTQDIIERDSLYHINEMIDNELLKKQLDICESGWTEAMLGNDETSIGAPCILHKYNDGFFWWNRKASSCDIAGEEMANCGSSNYDDSTLLILKEFVQNDSMEVMDKLKGRVMVEYNSGTNELVQILGFANSFPEEKYWEKIKDLYENLSIDGISEYAFQHLARMGRTTEEDIQEFMSYVKGDEPKEADPTDFDGLLEAVKDGKYSVSEDDDFGGAIYMNFRLNHTGENDYSPLMIGGGIETNFNVGPESDYPSVDKSLYERDSGDLAEFLAEAYPVMLMNSIKAAFRGFDPMAGSLEENVKRIKIWTGRIRTDKDVPSPSSKLFLRVPYNIEVPPEFFTREDINRPDEVALEAILNVIRRLQAMARRGAISNALYNTIQLENAKVNPEGYTEFIPGVDDQPEGEMVLNLAETLEEMREIELAAGNGVPMDNLQDRLEVLYRSFVTPLDDGSGYMIIDSINRQAKSDWRSFILDDDFWSEEFDRILADSRRRVAAMQADEADAEDYTQAREREYQQAIEREQARRDLERQRAMNNPEPETDRDALLRRGDMLLRFFGHRQRSRLNQAERGNLERFKQNMQNAGLWDEWWAAVRGDHPLKQLEEPLEEVNIMVESNKILGEKNSGVGKAHMNEDNSIRKGGVLPFKKDNGEFYFMLGQAPQGWWSDFRGGEEPEDGGDLKVTAAREFTEESSFELPVSLDDAHRIEHKNAAVFLTDLAGLNTEDFDISKVMKINKGRLAGTPEIVAVEWYHIEELPRIAKSRMPIIQKAIQALISPEPTAVHTGMAHGRTVGGDSYTPFLNESEGIKTLHIFDFDDTIAFTETFTKVTSPDGRQFKVDQAGLDKLLKSVDGGEDELRARGFVLDFSSFKTVSPDSQLNPVIVRRINDCCLAGGKDPDGDFYVLTARSAAAEDPIHKYLADNDIEIDRSKVIGVEGKSKASRIKSLIAGTDVDKVIFYDDSDNNIKDVAGLREDPDLKNVTFELYPVDHDGKIPQKPMQETIYERKAFKIRVGAK